MISRCPTPLANLVLTRADHPRLPDLLRSRRGDALVVQCADGGRGTYALLGAAEADQRVLFPARWLSARLPGSHPSSPDGRLLALARGDASLQRLLSETSVLEDAAGLVRPDQPLVLLGVPGDVLDCPGSSDAQELRRRAEIWIDRLGRDRVAVAVPIGDLDHPLARLAFERDLPLLSFVDADDSMLDELPVAGGHVPILWTDFQLDREHRLPDDAYVPGLRDLLHRGSLLRERTLYDHLPARWLDQAVLELRQLHEWHLGPLLRRTASLLQTLAPVRGVTVIAPLSGELGVCAYLLGLTDTRPAAAVSDVRKIAHAGATALATALADFDRRVVVHAEGEARRAVRQRLLGWADGGHLARCGGDDADLRFCFSGQPLWTRTQMQIHAGAFPQVDLSAADLRALGWFELQVVEASKTATPPATSAAEVRELFGCGEVANGQLSFDLSEMAPAVGQDSPPEIQRQA